ncbi:MAG: phosphoribosylanthranilate isomerase, partial [Candidatus Bathyarchaeia archaeon]
GITREEDLKAACHLGADMVGFVVGVPYSPRNLSLERAEQLIRLVPAHVKSVLVTVPQSLSQLAEIYTRLKPDIVQIHGNNLGDYDLLRRTFPEAFLVRALAVDSNVIAKVLEALSFFDAFHADTYHAWRHGGTGIVHDWSLSRRLRDTIYPKPLILAGGLNPWNVKEAIKAVKPYAVDVSTGVESEPGVKDHMLMEAFIKNAKEAY